MPHIPSEIDAVLPAGGRLSGAFAQTAGVEVKALIRFEDRTMLHRTLDTLRATGRIGRIAVIGPEETRAEARAHGADGLLPEGATGPDNIFRGLQWLQGQEHPTRRVLIVTTDMPFLTPEAITTYLDACPAHADICVPISERREFEARFPGCIRTDTPLRDGKFRLGGLFLLEAESLLRVRPHLEQMFAARKSDLQMARLIGLRTAVKFLARRLTVDDIVARASEILRCRGAAVREIAPELAFDIDLPEEYAYACAYAARMAARQQDSPPLKETTR